MHIILNESRACEVRELLRGKSLSFDFETTSTNWMDADIIGMGVADLNDEWFFVVKDGMEMSGLGRVLKGWFDLPNQTLIAHNAAFDMHFLNRLGINLKTTPYDTMGLAHLYNESAPLGLKKQAWFVLNRQPRAWDKTFLSWGIEEIAKYGCADVRNTYDLAIWYMDNTDKKLWPYYTKYVYLLPQVKYMMEQTGWTLDRKAVETYSIDLDINIMALKAELCVMAPGLDNPGSTQQLALALEKIGATWEKNEHTRTGAKSTAERVLKRMTDDGNSDVQAIASKILQYRKRLKLHGYLTGKRGLLASVADDEKIHPSWRIFGPVTGRWACASPNLQQVPKKRGDDEVNVRNWLIAGAGYKLVVADLSQAELRVLAGLSGDRRMVSAFEQGLDIHASTAAAIFDKCIDAVTKTERFIGKTTNFATAYGAGPPKIADVCDVSMQEAAHILKRFFKVHPGVARWIDRTKGDVMMDGVVYTAFGRPRHPCLVYTDKLIHDDSVDDQPPGYSRLYHAGFDMELHKKHLSRGSITQMHRAKQERTAGYLVERGKRQAVNAVIQGTVADVINAALIKLTQQGHQVVGQIHDEVVVRASVNDASRVAKQVKRALHFKIGNVVLTTDIEIKDRWGE